MPQQQQMTATNEAKIYLIIL